MTVSSKVVKIKNTYTFQSNIRDCFHIARKDYDLEVHTSDRGIARG